jgi:hypothetical protein
MDPLTIMRRADGKLFTLTIKGKEHLALWPSLQSAMRYKKRNPELLIFIPASVASPFGQKSLIALRKDNTGLFLLMDVGSAHFRDGHKIGWEELETSIPASPSGSAYQLNPSAVGVTPANLTDALQALNRLDDDSGKPNV